ncbi:MAG: AI-2E family transporter [Proteobacteria bacterium]|nr:AI-2E family transporter [Pseudomonadota bacterium]MBU1708489.1 AI-2E family transporter [Pseudomonadota bacterium]
MVFKYFLFLFVSSLLLVGLLFWPYLSILVLAYLLAALFQPIYKFINKKFSPGFSSFTTCMLIIILIFLPCMFFIGALSKEAFSLYQFGKGANIVVKLKEFFQTNSFIVRIQEILIGFGISFEPENFTNTLAESTKAFGLFLYNQASSWAANIMGLVLKSLILIVTIFFLLIDHDRFVDFMLRLSPLQDDQQRQLINKFNKIAGAVLMGNGICGLIQGVIGGLVFAFFDLGQPFLWGGIMAILAFLPIFGIGLVLIPASVIMLLKGNIATAIFLLIFYMILSFSIEYILKPKLVGKQVQMHTLLVFLAIMGGLSVFGILGIIYGPLILTAFLTLADIYLKDYDALVRNPSQD